MTCGRYDSSLMGCLVLAASPNNSRAHVVASSRFQLIPAMAEKNITGTFNFTNPGCITNTEILDAYKRNVDPSKTWEVASAEEAANVQKAGRPNHELDVSKMLALFPDVPHVKVGIDNLMKRVAAHRAAASTSTSQ
jgi:hypothetical protein